MSTNNKFTFADLFAGIGGFHAVLAHCGGRATFVSEIDKDAAAVYKRNWIDPLPEDMRPVVNTDINIATPPNEPLVDVPDDIDVLAGGFPCFVAGTRIITKDGFTPIEDVEIGDLVLTHERRWRPVTDTMTRTAPDTLTIRAMGAPTITTTDEHPFYVRRRTKLASQAYKRTFSEPAWVDAKDLTTDDFVGYPVDEPNTAESPFSIEVAYVIGRYIADGWSGNYKRSNRGTTTPRLVICTNPQKADTLRAALVAAGLHPTRVDEATVVKFHMTSQTMIDLLDDFGHTAPEKRLPGWVFDLPMSHQQAIWDGWIDGDGHRATNPDAWVGTTTSHDLALGMMRLHRNLHHRSANIIKNTPAPTKVIQGRTVNQRPWYRVTFPDRNSIAFYEDGFVWCQIRSIERNNEPAQVYNISVDEDESYTAEGMVVHNCQSFSKSGKQRGFEDETRGTLFFNICRVLKERTPSVILLENVRNLTGPRHTHEWDTIVNRLREIGYKVSSTPSILSPHQIPAHLGGTPQNRERVFILGTYVGPEVAMASDPEPTLLPGKIEDWNPHDWDVNCVLDPDESIENMGDYALSPTEVEWIQTWDDLVVDLLAHRGGKQLPGFPLWADEWRLPEDLDTITDFDDLPAWKQGFLIKNAEFYRDHKDIIDRWREAHPQFDQFPASRRKLEWQAQDATSLKNTVMHLRPSGIRCKKPTYLPALVAITQTSIIGSRMRRITEREAIRLQGMPETFDFGDQKLAASYKQAGNGVAVGAAFYALRQHVEADRHLIPSHVADAILSAPVNPCPQATDPTAR